MSKANTFPTKRFFVDMLVRDIELKDALLDLLDNCVDGAIRSNKKDPAADPERPYAGFRAEINFSETEFSISDNCGGIPLDIAKNSAFRLGRTELGQDDDLPTVGLYGIGMKRAIFKLGHRCEVISNDGQDAFSVEISPEWMESDSDWELDIVNIEDVDTLQPGTTVRVSQLREGVSRSFGSAEFETDFRRAAEAYYSYIIEKGFSVQINGTSVTSKKVRLLIEDSDAGSSRAIAPYVYKRGGDTDGVSILLTVGLYRPIPSEDEEERHLTGRASSEAAGWTIICNDRVVLHADKSRVTGWGEAGVPSYHSQFASIAGVVIFQSNDPELLPLTTTKRGVDGNSDLYLQVKDLMRDGMKVFTDFTNSWKKRPQERAELQRNALAALPEELARKSLPFKQVRKPIGGERHAPALPAPTTHTDAWIRFSRPKSEIRAVSSILYGHQDASPSDVGVACFERVLSGDDS